MELREIRPAPHGHGGLEPRLKYDRVLGVPLSLGVFLNIGRDHISGVEHPTFEDYFASKLRIFDQCETAW